MGHDRAERSPSATGAGSGPGCSSSVTCAWPRTSRSATARSSGGDPQDLKFKGEETWVEVGSGTIIREYSTINRAHGGHVQDHVGAGCFIMTYVHLAHDCHVGDEVVIANATQLAGHVTIHDRAVLSGLNAIHQFVTIGTYAFVGGCSRVNQDIPPYVKAVGQSDGAVRPQLDRPAARRVPGRDGVGPQARLPALLQLRSEPVAGARAGAQPICPRSPRWSTSSRSSQSSERGVPA